MPPRLPRPSFLRRVLPHWTGQAMLSAGLIVLLAYGLLFALLRGSVDVPFLYGGN
jgi:hypothetical protein